MSGVAILCSGQGAQHRDMFALTGTAPAAEPVFAAAAAHLGGVDPRQFVRDAGDDALFANQAGQVLCCTQAIAAWSALRPPASMIAGYSVGELAAWCCAGMLDPAQTLALASQRARLMDEAAAAGPRAGLLAIIGLRRDRIEMLLRETGCALAIVNGPDNVVAGGPDRALDVLAGQARAAGAGRVVRLRVAVAAHTPLLAGASGRFRQALLDTSPHTPSHALLSGIDGDRVRSVEAGCDRLSRQIAQTIDWSACLAHCHEAGAVAMLELGPGRVLARMATAALPGSEARALDDFRSIDGVRDWLRRAAG
ncbi:ACP S-malonyltransferase [Lichenicoccus roseus]|uniref:Acyltransferase domain-containing protein n=1 Tax=Lichenicoccus roseus TaxID=2683649 RepID=A0A5R9J5S5_9PROT|nr:acyltransferase domain-containing protein [Lichenicoccus roseus]TLU70961.1 acyltransferase domain-containing protein [Lichenicoccus roseus]